MSPVVDEEAGFIEAVLADPDERTVLLAYADWLDERDDPRAEYLRLVTSESPDQERLAHLGATLDRRWIYLVSHRLRVGARVRVLAAAFAELEGEVIGFDSGRRHVVVRLSLWGRSLEIDLDFWEVELVER